METVAGGDQAAARPTLFLRNATGLVKAWSGSDAFIYSFMSVNLVTLGFYTFSFVYTIPSGSMLTAVIVGGVFVSFLVITYAALVTAMPRAGGDYTWQSRILGGGPAFVLAMTGWWFILWHWTPIYASILNLEVFAPISATIGRSDWATFFGGNTGTGLFVTCLVVPYGALLLMVVPSLVVSALYAYLPNFSKLVLDATLVIAVTYLGSVVAAAILPWRRRTIFENSPIAKMRLAGVPVMTIAAVITGAFLVFNLIKWITDSTYGVNNTTSYIYMAVLYVLGIVWYVVALLYRRRQGIDLGAIHAEIPVE